ncbi:MAG: magnesium/cobalt transporter CorA [Nitrosopumilaceae archaeon]|nr:magnesium/cobalt transporter CorA [Nitrosopumilaceae archaeon]
MREPVGIIANRLVYGFTFAFLYQIVIGIATSLFSIPLTGNIQDLITGFENLETHQGPLLLFWWIVSTIIITGISLLVVRYRKYLSPYKEEKNIEIPPKITATTAIIIGAIMSFLFFLIDLILGAIIKPGSQTDVLAIYQAAMAGDFVPLTVSIIFSIIAGFIIVGVVGKTSRVSQFADELGINHLTRLSKIVKMNKPDRTTIADTIGLRPGELIHVGEKKVDKVRIELIEYDEKDFSENLNPSISECLDSKVKSNVSWVNIIGIHDPKIIEQFGNEFGVHSLHQANIMNTDLRPSIEVFEDYIQLMLKMPHFNEEKGRVELEQVSFILAQNHLLTFQEYEADFFDKIRDRLRNNIGTIRKRKSDYLCYLLVDAIVDSYFLVLEKISDITENLEDELMSNPRQNTLQTLQLLKRQMILLRKSMWPAREVIDSLQKSHSDFIHEETKTYLRDTYNHIVQVIDTIEGLRDVVGGLLDTYLSSVSNRMNEVMKTLTIIASIFIPITFIAGIYGTNFEYIPELEWEGSYFAMIGVMIIISLIMLAGFKKKQWL